MTRKIGVFLIILAVIAAIVVLKIFVFSGAGNQPSVSSAQKETENVRIFVVRQQTIDNSFFAAGTVLSDMEASLRPEVSGRVTAIGFLEGSAVTRGQLLVKLNDADLQAQLKKLEIEKKLAGDNEARQQQLLRINGISQEGYDQSLASLNSLKAEIELLQAQIDKTEIRAPFDGVVGLRSVDEGQYVTPANTLVTIQKMNPLKVEFSVPEQYGPMLSAGDKVSFTVKGATEACSAVVYAIEPKIDPSTRTIAVRARCEKASKSVFPGAFAEVRVALKQVEDALLIPTEAVIPVLRGKKVFLYKGGTASERMIQTGLRTENNIQVTEGLSAGDTVIVSGLMGIRDGAPVRVLKK